MRKIYLAVLLCALQLTAHSQGSFYATPGSDITLPTSWSAGADFTNPADTFVINVSTHIFSGETFTIAGHLVMSGSGILQVQAGAATMNIGGVMIMRDTSRITKANTARALTIYAYGDFTIKDTAFIRTSSSGAYNFTINLCDTANTLAAPATLELSSRASSYFTQLNINRRAVRQLVTNGVLPKLSSLNDSMMGTLICGTNSLASAGTDNFYVLPGATLITANTAGINGTLITMASLHLSGSANYVFNGSAPQVTGTLLPAIIGPDSGSVTINNPDTVTLSHTTTIDSACVLNLQNGPFSNSTLLTVNHGAEVFVDNGNLCASPNYTGSINVDYVNLGTDSLFPNTGMELVPTIPANLGNVIINKPGAIVSLGTPITIFDSLILNNGSLSSSTSSFPITLNGDWANYSGASAFIANSDTVYLSGATSHQNAIGGTFSTTFFNLSLANANGAFLGVNNDTVNGTLSLDGGRLFVGVNNLIIGPDATAVSGLFSSANMIVADTTGQVIKMLSGAPIIFFYPIGDSLAGGTYSPVNVDFTGSIFGAPSGAGVNLRKRKEPHNANLNNYLNRYWSISLQNFVAASYAVIAQYGPADVVGSEALMSMGQYTGFPATAPWAKYDPAIAGAHELNTGASISTGLVGFNNFTGITTAGPTATISDDTTICTPGGAYTMGVTGVVGDPGLTYSWFPPIGLSTTTGSSTIATPPTSFTYTLTIKDGNGFKNAYLCHVTVHNAPSVVSLASNSPLCAGDSLGTNALGVANVTDYAWAGPGSFTYGSAGDTAAVLNAPVAATGSYSLTVSNGIGIGCSHTYTESIIVNSLPLATTASGGGVFCDSAVLNATTAGAGTIFFEGTDSTGMDSTLGNPPITVLTSGTYYFRAKNGAGCWGAPGSVTVTVNPLPASYNVSIDNGGYFCASDSGVHIQLDNSDVGINYQFVKNGADLGPSRPGTGSAILFGLQTVADSYYVIAKNPLTGCTIASLDTVEVNPVPLPYQSTISSSGGLGGGLYCFGSPTPSISLDTVSLAYGYVLYQNNTVVDTMYASSTMFSSLTDGQYYVIAYDLTYGCTDTMHGQDTIRSSPLPNADSVLGGGTECSYGSGFDIRLRNSQSSAFTYNLVLYQPAIGDTNTVVTNSGTGGVIDFGTQNPAPLVGSTPLAAYYFVEAISPQGCVSYSLDTALITVNPAVVQSAVYGVHDNHCANLAVPDTIFLLPSVSTYKYVSYWDGVPSADSIVGNGGSLEMGDTFTNVGTYSIIAVDTTTGCWGPMSNSVTIDTVSMPLIQNLVGFGSFCNGGTGIDLKLAAAQPGITYQLYDSTAPIGSPIIATSTSALDFGNQSGAGSYSVTGFVSLGLTGSTAGCLDTMNGISSIVVLPLPNKYTVTGGGTSCFPGSSHLVGLSGSETGVSYVLLHSYTDTISTLTGTGSTFNFGNYLNAGGYTVVATRIATGCADTMLDSVNIVIYPLPVVQTVTGGGTFCVGQPGAYDTLISGSETHVHYQLYRNDSNLSPMWNLPGTGSSSSLVVFGPEGQGGVYRVVATNDSTGCSDRMTGSTINIANPVPVIFTIAGGGSYCAGSPGRGVYLDGSSTGKIYQLFWNSTAFGTLPGSGFGLNFGIQDSVGAYWITATDLTTGCTSRMADTVYIQRNTLPVTETVTGGGTYCFGGAGFPVNLSSSQMYVRYLLYRNGDSTSTSIIGTGTGTSFGALTLPGTYTVTATNIYTLCQSNMTDSAVIAVHNLPTRDTLTGGGAFCAGGTGVPMSLSSSDPAIHYQLKVGGVAIGGPRIGTGSPISFGLQDVAGTYTVTALDTAAGCNDTMAGVTHVVINPLPDVYTLTGGGSYCIGGAGVHVGLSGSDTGILYQLYSAAGLVGSPLIGATGSLDFGLLTAAGSYKVAAVNAATTCADTMTGSSTVTIQTYSTPVFTLHAIPDTIVGVGQPDTVIATVTSGGGTGTPSFQWYINGNVVYGATSDTFVFPVYFQYDSVLCQVTSSGMCGGITTQGLLTIHLKDVAVPQVLVNNGDVKLIPNPNKGDFTLSGFIGANPGEDVQLTVTNILGETVYKDKINANNGMINYHVVLNNQLANGAYLLSLSSHSGVVVMHFVLEQ